MKAKLAEYINTIFADAERRSPANPRLAELKEEMLQNLNEKYDDLLAEGRSPAAAYNIAVAGVGDITDLLEAVCGPAPAEPAPTEQPPKESTALTPEQEETIRRYHGRSAILTAIAVALYILCVVPAILLGDSVVGPTLMFVMVAVATALLIFNAMTKPKLLRDADDNDDDDDDGRAKVGRPRRSPVYGAISGALWVLTVCVYLLVSYASGYWHITWMIFLIATAVDNIIKAIFDIRR